MNSPWYQGRQSELLCLNIKRANTINPAIKYIVLTYLFGALENPAQMRKSA